MMWLALAPILIVMALPSLAEWMRRPPEPGAGHDLRGRTHVTEAGPARGAKVLCIHGLTTPLEAFDGITSELVAAGYRVWRYDLYGRGKSDNVRGRQDEALFLEQLDGVMQAEGLTEEITLIGYSMGGSIATAAAALWPERMRRVILLAPAGIRVPGVEKSPFRWPLVGRWLGMFIYPLQLRWQISKLDHPVAEVQRAQLSRRGFFPAVLSSFRNMLAQTQEVAHRRLAKLRVPVVAIWGGKDDVIPLEGLGRLAEWNRNAKQEVVDEADHGLPFTHAHEVSEIIKSVLREP